MVTLTIFKFVVAYLTFLIEKAFFISISRLHSFYYSSTTNITISEGYPDILDNVEHKPLGFAALEYIYKIN